MQITMIQGIMLSVMAFILGVDFWLEAFFIFRPIIVCTLTGFIIGNPTLGIVAGGLTELTFAGLTPAGGTQPPNPILAGVMTVVLAHTTGTKPEVAIGLSLPFSFLMQYIILFYYSSFTAFTPKADKLAMEGNTKDFWKLPLLATVIVGFTYALVVFLSTYAAQNFMRDLVNSFPEWLIHGFSIAGGILPAIGFGMLLRTMLKIEYVPFLIIGFVLANFIKFSNLLPIAAIGTALALISYFRDLKLEKSLENIKIDEGEEDGI